MEHDEDGLVLVRVVRSEVSVSSVMAFAGSGQYMPVAYSEETGTEASSDIVLVRQRPAVGSR